MDKKTTKIYKSGNSQAITLQNSILKESDLLVGDEVNYYVDDKNRIIITKKEKSFEERWTEFIENGGTYEEEEIDWGKSVGRELW